MMPYPKPPVNSHALITLLAYALSHPHSAAWIAPLTRLLAQEVRHGLE